MLSIRKDEELSANEVLERIRSSELQAQQLATEHEREKQAESPNSEILNLHSQNR